MATLQKALQKEDYEHYLPPLLEKIKSHTSINAQKIEKAFYFAGHAHRFDMRKSGEPYIMHPVGATEILLDHYVDETSLIATLLHDTIEDTDVTYQDIQNEFGENVAFLVESVSHFTKATKSKENKDIQTLRKIFLSMNKDIRVIYVKLADRMHNMLTLEHMPRKNQIKKSEEVKDVYVGLAKSLNLWSWKRAFEDLCFKYLEPEIYKEVQKNVFNEIKISSKKIQNILNQITKTLIPLQQHILSINLEQHSISGIVKNLKKENTKPNINDIHYIDIIIDDRYKCYLILAHVHDAFKAFNSKLKDYFSIPKENGYEALHTTIFTDFGLVDIKIKTQHSKQKTDHLRKELSLREKNIKDHINFKESLGDVFSENIRVYASTGEEKSIPKHASILDFVILSYKDKALFFDEIYVNNKKVTLEYTLKHNDMVEIVFTNHKKHIRLGWFDLLKSFSSKHSLTKQLGGEEVYKNLKAGYRTFIFWQKVFDIPSLEYIYNHYEKNIIGYESFEFALIALAKREISINQLLMMIIPLSHFRVTSVEDIRCFSLTIDQVSQDMIHIIMKLLFESFNQNLPQELHANYEIEIYDQSCKMKYFFKDFVNLIEFLKKCKKEISHEMKIEYIF